MGNPIDELQQAVKDLKDRIAAVQKDVSKRCRDELQPDIDKLTDRISDIEKDARKRFKTDSGVTKNEAFGQTGVATGVAGEVTGAKLEGSLATVGGSLFKAEFVKWD